MTTLPSGIVVPQYFTEGLGYSPASGPAVGGGGPVSYSPAIFSSTFFGSDIRLFPRYGFSFSNKKLRLKLKRKKNRKSPKKSNKKKKISS